MTRGLRVPKPVLLVLLLAPVTAEYLIGYDDITGNPAALAFGIVFFAPLYGAPAVLIRELTRRRGLGWPSILILAAAFGLIEAGLVDQSLFDPAYRDIPYWDDLRDPTFLPWLGTSASMLLGFVGGHVLGSIAAPIAMAESWWPERARGPWLGPTGLVLTALLWIAGSAFILVDQLGSTSFRISPWQLWATVVAVLTLFAGALSRHPARGRPGRVPAPWLVALVSALLLTVRNAVGTTWPCTLAAAGSIACWLVLMGRWSTRSGWDGRHLVAALVGDLLSIGVPAFFTTPLGNVPLAAKLTSNVVLLALVLALAVRGYRAERRWSAAAIGPVVDPCRAETAATPSPCSPGVLPRHRRTGPGRLATPTASSGGTSTHGRLPMTDAISIPADLKPADGRFGAGPSKIQTSHLDALAATGMSLMGTSHRQAPVRGLVRRVQEGLATFFDLPDGYEVVLGNGGATAFWDVASYGLIRRKSQHLSFGEFSSKFASVVQAAPWLDDPSIVTSEPGTRPDPQAESGVDVYAWPHNETSTTVMAPVRRVAGADDDALTLIDATSGGGGLPVDLTEADVYYFAPQKSFASDGGLFVALMSPAALARATEIKESGRHIPAFLDLVTAIEQSRLNQTYNTPSIATFVLMAEQLDWMNANGSLAGMVERTTASADALYGWAEKTSYTTPYVADPDHRSLVIGNIDFDEAIDAKAISAALRANGIVDTEPYRKLGRNQLRIAMYPAIDASDVEALTACIDYVIDHLS